MPSLDFALDCAENLKSQEITFMLITSQEKKDGTAVMNTFYYFQNEKKSMETLTAFLNRLLEQTKVAKKKNKKHGK